LYHFSARNVVKSLYKMKNVSELTGFSPTLLRAWERRYDILEPDRLPGGHRVYGEDDLAVLMRVKKLMAMGQSIGRVAALGREKLLDQSLPETSFLKEAHGLASNELEVFRTGRYGGEDLGVSLRTLGSSDLRTVVALYEQVKSIYEMWMYTEGRTEGYEVLRRKVRRLYSSDLLASVARLGSSSALQSPFERAALEDTKWGALGPLSRLGERLELFDEEALKLVVLLSRDHAKLMRNAFYDLDPGLREADESLKAHGTPGAVKKVQKVCPEIETILDWEGSYSSRCLETSTVDRVLYDFLRRIRQADSGSASLWVGAVNDSLMRWAFHSETDDFAKHGLEDLATLAVARSAGVSPKAALEMGYLGSGAGWAWFHWPIFTPPPGVSVCQCEL
jgi:DNA-binding transcriptional MerR regulator